MLLQAAAVGCEEGCVAILSSSLALPEVVQQLRYWLSLLHAAIDPVFDVATTELLRGLRLLRALVLVGIQVVIV